MTRDVGLPQIGEGVPKTEGQLQVKSSRWSSSSKKILLVLALLLPVLLVGASLRGRPSYALTAFGDLTQLFMLATATLFFAWKGFSARGTPRAFWFLIALGFGMWSVNMVLWVYYEVWLNQPVPSVHTVGMDGPGSGIQARVVCSWLPIAGCRFVDGNWKWNVGR